MVMKLKKMIAILLVIVLSLVVLADGEGKHVHGEDCEHCIVQTYNSTDTTTNQIFKIETIDLLVDPSLSDVEFENFKLEILERINELERNIGEQIFLAIEYLNEEITQLFERVNVTLDIHDSDIAKIYETLGKMTEELQDLNQKFENISDLNATIDELNLRLGIHEQDIINIFNTLALKAQSEDLEKFEERLNNLEIAMEENNGALAARLELLEEYTNLIYSMIMPSVSIEDVESLINPLKQKLEGMAKDIGFVLAKTKEQEVDIIKLYDAVAKLAEEVKRISGRLSILESIVNELRKK